MADDVESDWHGWVHEDRALYLAPTNDGEHMGLFLQQARSTELCAVFLDPALAAMVMGWMDDSLTATGRANSELLTRLQNEQPLLFVPRPDESSSPSYDGEVDSEP